MPSIPEVPADFTSKGAPHVRTKLEGPTTIGSGVPFSSDFEYWVKTGRWEHVESSNVAAIAYDVQRNRLLVRYRSGPEWAYSPISLDIAATMYKAGSKGDFVWSFLKVRGKGNAKIHQVNAVRIN